VKSGNVPFQALPFAYPEVASPASGSVAFRPADRTDAAPLAAQIAERELKARELGRQQAEAGARASFEEQLLRERAAIAKALADFARGRAAFYQKIEQEAVQLALSIARKVLHREAQVDPLLLMGIVRVALERLEGVTGVALAVAKGRAGDWQKYLASRLAPEQMPEVTEDAALGPDQCQIRTSMGTADLGLEVQLKEIEQGLMDLLASRPREK
jgi:flagellar assembly protein FliH